MSRIFFSRAARYLYRLVAKRSSRTRKLRFDNLEPRLVPSDVWISSVSDTVRPLVHHLRVRSHSRWQPERLGHGQSVLGRHGHPRHRLRRSDRRRELYSGCLHPHPHQRRADLQRFLGRRPRNRHAGPRDVARNLQAEGVADPTPPEEWLKHVNEPETDEQVKRLRESIQRGRPYGTLPWMTKTAQEPGLESSLRPRGRPKKQEAGRSLFDDAKRHDGEGEK